MTGLPASWRMASLRELGVVAQPGFASGGHNKEGRGILHLRPMNISRSGRLDTSDCRWVEDSSDRRVSCGDVLFNNTNSPELVGKTAMVNLAEPVAYSNHMTRLRAPEGVLDARFLAWQLQGLWEQGYFKSICSNHVNQASVATKRLLEVQVSVPALDEQRCIVDLIEDHLSRLDAATRLATDARHRGVAFVRRLLLDAVLGDRLAGRDRDLPSLSALDLGGPRPPTVALPSGWRWLKWRDVGTSQNGRLFPSSDYQANGLRLLRPGNLRADGFLDWKPAATKCLPERYGERYPDLLLNSDDLVMNLTAQSLKDDFLGRVCLVREGDIALLNQRLARLVPSEVSPAFAMLVFRSPLFRRYVSSLNSGSLIQHMFTKQIAEFWLPVPPRPEQELVVQRVDVQLQAWSVMDQTLDRLGPRVEAAKRALLGAAFCGRLNTHRAALEGSDV